MLACKLDLPIGIDVPLTILSAILAVLFTFLALASDLLWNRYIKAKRRKNRRARKAQRQSESFMVPMSRQNSNKPLLRQSNQAQEEEESEEEETEAQARYNASRDLTDEAEEMTPYRDEDSQPGTPFVGTPGVENEAEDRLAGGPRITDLTGDNVKSLSRPTILPVQNPQPPTLEPLLDSYAASNSGHSDSNVTSSNFSNSRRSSSYMGSNASSYGLKNMINTARSGASKGKNAFVATGEALYSGLTRKNIVKSFFWSVAITSMHYVGIAGLRIPSGYYTLNPYLFVLSGLISWVVCLIGCILMAQMETHLSQQLLFSFVATAGVAAMHFTGRLGVSR